MFLLGSKRFPATGHEEDPHRVASEYCVSSTGWAARRIGTPNISRRRDSALLMVAWPTPIRFTAAVTLRSAKRISNATRRLESNRHRLSNLDDPCAIPRALASSMPEAERCLNVIQQEVTKRQTELGHACPVMG